MVPVLSHATWRPAFAGVSVHRDGIYDEVLYEVVGCRRQQGNEADREAHAQASGIW